MTEVKALSHGRVVRLRVRQGFCCLGLGFSPFILSHDSHLGSTVLMVSGTIGSMMLHYDSVGYDAGSCC